MPLFEYPIATIDGEPTSLGEYQGRALLLVNVASNCGLTPQYEGLEELHGRYRDRGFSVLGFPCNQFLGQEPGTTEEIKTFCSVRYGVTFPLFEKVEVNGQGQHPIYAELVTVPDADGYVGDIRWNFEKFLVSPDGGVVARYAPQVEPQDDVVLASIEAHVPK